MPTEITTDHSNRIRPARLWFGAVGSVVAWALQGFTCFEIAVQACRPGGPLSPTGFRVLIGCVSAAYLAVAIAAALVSYQNWRTLSDAHDLMQAEGYGREEYMALAGVFVGVATIIGLVWAGIPAGFFDVCNTFR